MPDVPRLTAGYTVTIKRGNASPRKKRGGSMITGSIRLVERIRGHDIPCELTEEQVCDILNGYLRCLQGTALVDAWWRPATEADFPK